MILFLFYFTSLWAQERTFDDYFQYITNTSKYSPVDGAASHNGAPAQYGIGYAAPEAQGDYDVMAQQIDQRPQSAKEKENPQFQMYKFYWLKGVFYPLDVGLSASLFNSKNVAGFIGGHVQATIFEGFRLPAVAARVHYNRSYGLYSTLMEQTGVELVASQGFLSYFTVYGTAGQMFAKSTMRLENDNETKTFLASEDDKEKVEYKKNYFDSAAGLSIEFLPNYFILSAESQKVFSSERNYQAKLAFYL